MTSHPESLEDFSSAEEAPIEFHLSDYWPVIVKRRRLIALSIAVGIAAAALASISAKPTYRAAAILSVEKDRGSPTEINSIAESTVSFDPDFLPTQMRLMRSREIGERVAKRLNLIGAPVAQDKKSGFFRKSASGSASNSATTSMALWVQGKIDVTQLRGTSLVEISCIAGSPKLAADLANATADAYIEWTLESRFRSVGETSQFLAAQIQQVRTELEAKERQLLAYGKQKDIVSVDPTSNVAVQNLQALNADFAAATADRVTKEARYNELRNARAESIADTSGMVAQIRNEQARMEREYAEKSNLYKPEWPAMQQLKIQIDKGRQHLDSVIQATAAQTRETARSDYQQALRREANLKGVLGLQKSETMSMNSNAVEYNHLKTEVETKKALVDGLLKRQGETDVMSRLSGDRASNTRVVDRALIPTSRYSPSYKKNGLLGLLAGTVLGIGSALFLFYLDRSLRTAEDVERYVHVPSLGVIPTVGRQAAKPHAYAYGPRLPRRAGLESGADESASIELLPHRHPKSRVAERYRAFRTSLLLSQAGGVKSIVVTSATPKEGKTVTAVNLAVVLGQVGKRVLLVDADLHRPRLHEVFHVSNRTGLVSILAEGLSPERAVIPTEIPEVFLVPSGPSTPNPSGLLSSEAMSNFLDLARMNYDYVILDAPPVLPVADSIVVGHQTDGAVVCVRGGETPREQVALACENLRRNGVRILGVLINNLLEDVDRYGTRYEYDENYYPNPTVPAKEKSAVVATTRLI